MASEMTAKERSVYEMTAMLSELLPYLEQNNVLADLNAAATKTKQFFDEMAPHYGWPVEWRGYAHVDFLDLNDTD
jgi:hypothetical protein